MPSKRKSASPFRYYNSLSEVIRLVAMMYISFALSLRNAEDLLFERGIDICHEIVRLARKGAAARPWLVYYDRGAVDTDEIERGRRCEARGIISEEG